MFSSRVKRVWYLLDDEDKNLNIKNRMSIYYITSDYKHICTMLLMWRNPQQQLRSKVECRRTVALTGSISSFFFLFLFKSDFYSLSIHLGILLCLTGFQQFPWSHCHKKYVHTFLSGYICFNLLTLKAHCLIV